MGGPRLGEQIVHQADFLGVLTQLQQSLPELTPTEIWTGFVLYQLANDPQEPHNHAIDAKLRESKKAERKGELLKSTIGEERKYNPAKSIKELTEEACLKFDLSPKDAEFLYRFILKEVK